MREKAFSRAAVSLFAGLFIVLFCTALFIPPQADHDCTYTERCPGCLQLRGAINLFKQMESVYVRLPGTAVFFGAPALFSKISPSGPAPSTSISLKVRMNT
jgi:hypothetical protein